MDGWIKLHRKIFEHWIMKNPHYFKAWITMLIIVNYDDKKCLIHGEVIECKRGQSILSLDSWVKIFSNGWTKQKVRTFFELLKNDSMIELEGLRKTTRLTICNYDNYQIEQHTNNTQRTRKQHTDNTQVTPTKELEEVKKEKNIFIKPSIEEINLYCKERNNTINAYTFFNHYESNGWMIGKNRMKDWKAAIRTWESKNVSVQPKSTFTPSPR